MRELRKVMNLTKLKVKRDVTTRWTSALIILERHVEIKSFLSTVLFSFPQIPEFLDGEEWDVISDSIPIFKPFENMTPISNSIYDHPLNKRTLT